MLLVRLVVLIFYSISIINIRLEYLFFILVSGITCRSSLALFPESLKSIEMRLHTLS